MALRTGVDMIKISRLVEIQPAIKARFLSRVYTLTELEECQDLPQSLAGKFAAKEAVAKALGCGIGPVSWQEIEILHGPQGEPLLSLNGQAQVLALSQGLTEWSISISHTQEYAIAMVVALGEILAK